MTRKTQQSDHAFGFKMKIMVIILSVYCLTGLYQFVIKKTNIKEDNIIEEILEDYVESETNIKFDFTPYSEED